MGQCYLQHDHIWQFLSNSIAWGDVLNNTVTSDIDLGNMVTLGMYFT